MQLRRPDSTRGTPFDFISVALTAGSAFSRTFTGFKVGGGTVTHTVTGNAVFNDFETFTFPATFQNLERVEVDIANIFTDDFMAVDSMPRVPALEAGGLVTLSALMSAMGVGLLRRKRST